MSLPDSDAIAVARPKLLGDDMGEGACNRERADCDLDGDRSGVERGEDDDRVSGADGDRWWCGCVFLEAVVATVGGGELAGDCFRMPFFLPVRGWGVVEASWSVLLPVARFRLSLVCRRRSSLALSSGLLRLCRSGEGEYYAGGGARGEKGAISRGGGARKAW